MTTATDNPPPARISARWPSSGSRSASTSACTCSSTRCHALWTIWALTGAAFPWPLIVMGAWGIGLIMNAYDVYGREPIREEEIQREIERLRGV